MSLATSADGKTFAANDQSGLAIASFDDPNSYHLALPAPRGNDANPVLSPDGLALYFARSKNDTQIVKDFDVWVSTRATTNDDFGAPTKLVELETTDDEMPTFVSADGCRIYFDRGTPTTTNPYQSYVATRTK